jgi:hypothetical protein
MRNVWQCDWGEFEIPADVPIRFRRDGWFDRRLKITKQLKKYFSDMNARMRDFRPIQTWAEWTNG